MTAVATPRANRLFYMDALRCFCMLFGIFVHSASIDFNREFPLLVFVRDASDLFRMSAFFLISGYFTAFVYARSPQRALYTVSRRDVLLVPFLTALLLLNPVTNWLIYNFHNPPLGFHEYFFEGGWQLQKRGMGNWLLHLWFLVSLIIYAALTPLLMWGVQKRRVAALIDDYVSRTGRFTIWWNVLLVGLAAVGAQAVYTIVSPLVGGTPVDWVTRASLYYFPFFFLGLISFANRDFFERMHAFSWWGIIVFGGLYAIMTYTRIENSALSSVGFWLARAGLTTFLIAGLLDLFRHVADRQSPVLSFLVDASYSFYLFHMMIIYVIANIMWGYTHDFYVIFWTCVIVGTPVILGLHAILVRPIPLIRFLLNGKRVRPSAVVTAQASAER